MSAYIRYSGNLGGGGGSGSGVTVYPTFASFPASAPNGTLAVAGDTHIVYEYNTTTVAWEPIASHSSYVNSSTAITALTGDATATGPGSVPITLATVNSNTGTFGSASVVPSITVNGKGLTTAVSTNSIQIAESQVTNLVSDLASKINTSAIGAANGVAPLDASTKIPVAYLPSVVMEYQGSWNPSTNTPALSDGTGTNGYVYYVSAAFAGPVSGLTDPSMVNFQLGDLVIYSSSVGKYQLASPANGVQSVNGAQGVVTVNAINQLTGDVAAGPASGSASAASTIQPNVVSNSKLAQMPTLTLKGNNTGGIANASDLTVAQVNAILPVFTSSLNGLTPASGGGSTNFLRADGTWAAPSGSSVSVGLIDSQTKSTDGAVAISNVLYLQSADSSFPGLVTTGAQTLAGAKTFSTAPILSSLTASQALVLDGSKNVTTLGYGSANVNSTLVERDGSGNFSAGTITASLTGTASGNTTITPANHSVVISSATNALSTAAPSATSGIALVSNGSSADPSFGALNLAASGSVTGILPNGNTTATNLNTASAIVARDGSGNFSAGTITAALTGTASGNTTITPSNHAVVLSSASNALSTAAPSATTGVPLVSNGSSADPSFGTASVAGGGTGLTSGTSGGILGFTASGTLASSAALTANQLIVGGGAGATPSTLAAGTEGYDLQMIGSSPVPTWARRYPIGKVNYIDANPLALSGTEGWATYSNTAANIPSTGTGGTATGLTFSRITAGSSLRNSTSFSMVQTNSTNIQGKGVSYDFTIDPADQAKVLSVAFDFNASSTFVASNGTTAPLNDGTTSTNAGNSDIEVFLYDKTNSQLIYCSPQVITANGTNNFSFKGTFQTANNSTSYRLIFHVATANANATGWTFLFDNVYVGPQILVQGSAITDWISYTPTYTGLGTVASSQMYYRRVGDSIQIAGDFTTGTTTATTASVSLPSGLTTASFPAARLIGYTMDGATSTTWKGILASPSSTTINFTAQNSTTTGLTAQNGSTIFGNATQISLFAEVPILGWSSTVQMSNDTDTRVVAMRAISSSTTVGTSQTTVVYPVTNYDTHGGYNTSTGIYTIPISGYYRISAAIEGSSAVSSSATNNQIAITVFKNGSSFSRIALYSYIATGVAVQPNLSGSTEVQFNAGDTVNIAAVRDANVGSFSLSGNSDTWFTIERLSGPATIAAADTVAAKYNTTSQAIGTTDSPIIATSKEFDTTGSYNTSTGIFTAPVSGKYRVSSSVRCTTTTPGGVNNQIFLTLYKNGSAVSELSRFICQTTSSISPCLSGTTIVQCVAGDQLSIDISRDSSISSFSLAGSATGDWISFERIGN